MAEGGKLEVRGLSVRYGDAQALFGATLSADLGAITSIVGANGAGKTTLVRAIAGMVPSESGDIVFRGESIRGLSSADICERGIGQVPEGRQIFPSLAVEENLKVGALLARARARASRNLERVYAMFPRLAERRAQRAGTLSGGEQQMLAIGRCLMGEPTLIMLDEPSLGLSPMMTRHMFEVVATLHREGLSILLIEQNVRESLALSGRSYVLENGSVVLEGDGKALLDDERVKSAYLGI